MGAKAGDHGGGEGGGGDASRRTPQSVQSEPNAQWLVSEAAPPSSHSPSPAYLIRVRHTVRVRSRNPDQNPLLWFGPAELTPTPTLTIDSDPDPAPPPVSRSVAYQHVSPHSSPGSRGGGGEGKGRAGGSSKGGGGRGSGEGGGGGRGERICEQKPEKCSMTAWR